MEHLCEAAIAGDTDSLHAIVEKDPKILHKVAAGCFNGAASPLHVATSSEQTDFVIALLSLKPELKLRLTQVLDSQLRSALHLASALGHNEIARVLVGVNPKMCLVHDRDGKNPVHVAAMEGNISVLEAMVKACPQAARVRVDQNETILHLCVKHNQPESLKKLLEMIQGHHFVNAKDSDGNTMLHLAILYKHFEVTRCILEKKIIDVNATNGSGHTALDILLLGSHHDQKEVDHIEDILRQANAKQAKDFIGDDWLARKRDTLMIVASLIATMAFQAMLAPPGGVWVDNSDGHVAGEAIMAYSHPTAYKYFLRFSAVGFLASVTTIKLLISGIKFKTKAMVWILMVIMWVAIGSVGITFAFAILVITPKSYQRSVGFTVEIGVLVWMGVMSTLSLYHTANLARIIVKETRSKKRAIQRIMGFRPQTCLELACVKGGGATPPQSLTPGMSSIA